MPWFAVYRDEIPGDKPGSPIVEGPYSGEEARKIESSPKPGLSVEIILGKSKEDVERQYLHKAD